MTNTADRIEKIIKHIVSIEPQLGNVEDTRKFLETVLPPQISVEAVENIKNHWKKRNPDLKKLKRELGSDEYVHHKNGIKDDNRIENLEIMTKKLHRGIVECPHCRKIFSIR